LDFGTGFATCALRLPFFAFPLWFQDWIQHYVASASEFNNAEKVTV